MSEKKHIDKLFKERLKDFEVAPNDAVWQRIESELNKDKRKRRVVPIWWKVAGVAAALILMFTIGNSVLNNSIEKEVVDTEKTKQTPKENNAKTNALDLNTSEGVEQNHVVDNENTSEEKNNSTISPNNLPTEDASKNTGVASSEENNKNSNDAKTETKKEKSLIKNESLQRDAVVYNQNNNSKTATNENTQNRKKTTVVENSNKSTTQNENLNNDISKEKSEIDKLIKQTKTKNATQVTSSNASQKDSNTTLIDTSSTKVLKTENAIEKAIADANKEDNEKLKDSISTLKRWSVAPNIAPVYFNSFGNGSSIDEQFVDNNKEGEINMSYGVKGTYAISKKFTVRAGINKVDLGYSTNNVVTFANPNSPSATSRALQNINSSDTTTTYISASNFSFASGPEILFIKEQGSISQQLGFIEVPIELEYHILDKKIGLDVIGGFSTLFLSDNNVYSVENNGTKTRLGEATNINDMSYSANFGIGVNYNISQQLRFNLEPTFKYQINTFNNTSGDFKPFFIGVYTGLSFKF